MSLKLYNTKTPHQSSCCAELFNAGISLAARVSAQATQTLAEATTCCQRNCPSIDFETQKAIEELEPHVQAASSTAAVEQSVLDSPIAPDQYSLNFMWINGQFDSSQEFLIGNDEADFQQKFVLPIMQWLRNNPQTTINIWVDSQMTTDKAIRHAMEALQHAPGTNNHIQFRNVREIKIVHDNPSVFSTQTPIYFRVDLLKAIAADCTLRNEAPEYFVFADLDVPALSRGALFDERTIATLDDHGFIMAKFENIYENSFLIIKKNTEFLDSHFRFVIKMNILKTRHPELLDEQDVYLSYRDLMNCLTRKQYPDLHCASFAFRYPASMIPTKDLPNIPLSHFCKPD